MHKVGDVGFSRVNIKLMMVSGEGIIRDLMECCEDDKLSRVLGFNSVLEFGYVESVTIVQTRRISYSRRAPKDLTDGKS